MKKTKRWIIVNKRYILPAIILIVFPLIVGIFYALPLPQFIAVESDSLLSYYGTAFGVFVSVCTFLYDKGKKEKERRNELKPVFSVEVKKDETAEGIFEITIRNLSKRKLFYFDLYFEHIKDVIEADWKQTFKVSFRDGIKQDKEVDVEYEFNEYSKIIDDDGYPKSVYILCEDEEGNGWDCEFFKIKDGNRIYYYPCEFSIVN